MVRKPLDGRGRLRFHHLAAEGILLGRSDHKTHTHTEFPGFLMRFEVRTVTPQKIRLLDEPRLNGDGDSCFARALASTLAAVRSGGASPWMISAGRNGTPPSVPI